MRLILTKKQAERRGLFGGHRGMQFSLHARVELTPEERSLIDTYRAAGHLLAVYTHPKFMREQEVIVEVTPALLIGGYEAPATESVTKLLALEDDIKKACSVFKKFLVIMERFEGEDIIEYDEIGDIVESESHAA